MCLARAAHIAITEGACGAGAYTLQTWVGCGGAAYRDPVVDPSDPTKLSNAPSVSRSSRAPPGSASTWQFTALRASMGEWRKRSRNLVCTGTHCVMFPHYLEGPQRVLKIWMFSVFTIIVLVVTTHHLKSRCYVFACLRSLLPSEGAKLTIIRRRLLPFLAAFMHVTRPVCLLHR